jgi:succinate dehydrogenase / fumarate reductase cytochrome b subunit
VFLPTTTVGKKITMAATGQMMLVFVLLHVLGNSTIYFSNLNAYAAALHALPILLWTTRLFMLSMLVIHVYFGIVLTLENHKAKPQGYAMTRHLSATFAGKNMIWTGSVVAAFLIYHLLHFTVQVIDPEISALAHPDAHGRPDVSRMVVLGLQQAGIAAVYVASVFALLLHLWHGIQSSFQTWGLNNDKAMPYLTRGGSIAATLLFLGYAAIPLVIVAGMLK